MIFQSLECNPRLIATGGYCADHSGAIYSNLLDPRMSKSELINHGDMKTHQEMMREADQRAASVHHHFS